LKIYGIILILLGCIGLALGHIMFADIGIACTFSAIVALVTGVAFIHLDEKLRSASVFKE